MSEFQIFVRTLEDKTQNVTVFESDKVIDLKNRISAIIGLPVKQMMLIFNSKQLNDNDLVKDYSIQKNCQVMVIRQLKGGL